MYQAQRKFHLPRDIHRLNKNTTLDAPETEMADTGARDYSKEDYAPADHFEVIYAPKTSGGEFVYLRRSERIRDTKKCTR